ncbi:transposase family protein [Streptomyces hyaluromycini]|uniref:Transposase family protein n=1 Tax=Streptomyces hyaluromycini TaxID=1377993 RepID=A0ABV1X7W5_9ACTN
MNEISLRLEELLFPSIADVAVLSVDVNVAIVRVDVRCTAAGASCPGCGAWSARVHGSYVRLPADVPSGGRSVVLQLRVRRFTCRNAECGRRTFVEQIPGLTRRNGQRTERLRSTLAAIGLALAGRAGARLADIFGAPVSRSTVLRLVYALPEPAVPAPRVVGVDEYATRKGRYYGTVLGTTSAKPPSGASPSTADVCVSWFPRHLEPPRRSPTPRRRRPARRGRPATGSPTEPGLCMPRSMPWWRRGTAAARSSGSSE